MGKTTFSGPVRSLSGFNPYGYSNVYNVANGTNTLTLTAADHGGKLITVDDATMIFTVPAVVATEPDDPTDPNQLCNLGLTFRFLFTTIASAVEINLSGSDEFLGAIYQIDTDTSDGLAVYPAEAADNFVSIDLNGTTKGGRVGSYVEITAAASGIWLVSGTVLASGVVATPFAT